MPSVFLPKSCPATVGPVLVFSAITIVTLFTLFPPSPSPSLNMLMPKVAQKLVQSVINYSSKPNSTAENTIFTNFGAVRRTFSEIITMSVSKNSLDRKVEFLEMSLTFVRERLLLLQQTSEQFRLEVQKFSNVESSFDTLKASLDKSSNEPFGSNLADFFTEVGNWLDGTTDEYEQIMSKNIKQCSSEMTRLEEKISRQIYEIQHGELCEKTTKVLLFRKTTTSIFLRIKIISLNKFFLVSTECALDPCSMKYWSVD